MQRVTAVVVTYNRCEMLQRCLAHLAAQTAPCDVLVVDNASTDGTQQWLREYCAAHPGVRVLRMQENTGGAGGFSAGIEESVKAGYDGAWIMDDDCLPQSDALERLLEADRLLGGAEHYGLLSSAVLWTDGRECRMNRQKLRKRYYEYLELLQHGLVQIEQATFVSLLIPAATVRKVGLPIREFFIWGDDIEYTRRIAVRHGMPCFMAGASRVVHAMEHNSGSSIAEDGPQRIARYNYAYRNENYLYRMEGIRGFAYYTAKCAKNAPMILLRAKDHRAARLAVIVRQYICGLFFNPKIAFPDGDGEKAAGRHEA